MLERSRVVIVLFGCAIASGCFVYDPALVNRDGGTCTGRVPPARPTSADGEDGEELFFGLRDVVLNQDGDVWRDIGFNLDGHCTTMENGYPHECEPGLPGARHQPDGQDGIDNTFGSGLFPLVEATVPGLEQTARSAQLAGIGLPVLRVRGWNGQDDDPRVDVTIAQAVVAVPGGEQPPEIVIDDYMAELPDGSPAPAPNWDGQDYVWLRSDNFLAGNPEQPLVSDDNAYVSGRRLVVNLPDRVEILFPTEDAGVMVRLTGGVAVGRISDDGLRIEDQVVAGRWSLIDLLRTAENVGVCMGTPNYGVLNNRLQAILDVRSEPGSGGAGVTCDAISIGVLFTGYRLRFADVADGRPLNSLCGESTPDGGTPEPDAGPGEPDAGTAVQDSGS